MFALLFLAVVGAFLLFFSAGQNRFSDDMLALFLLLSSLSLLLEAVTGRSLLSRFLSWQKSRKHRAKRVTN